MSDRGRIDPDGGPFDDFEPPPFDPAMPFNLLDEELPLALFPVRLEARFLPDENPTEIVVRVFPDEIHADAHDPALTGTELVLAQGYWDWVWRVGNDPAGVAEARDWLAGQLGPHRAVYVAWASRPLTEPPVKPTPSRPKLRAVETRELSTPGTARLMPTKWAAFVEELGETAGPFWAAHDVASPLPMTPALVEWPEGTDARGFLDAQGLGWMHDLEAAENAGMVIRIPIASLPEPTSDGYDAITVLGVATGTEQDETLRELLDAHRYTRGLDLLPPGTPTNVTEASPEGVGTIDVGALFDAEFSREDIGKLPPPPRGGRKAPTPVKPPSTPAPPPKAPTPSRGPLMSASPADAIALALGITGETAVDLAPAADDPEAELARAANQALWPATWGSWLTDPMSIAGAPLIDHELIAELRTWFVDHVRAEGPLPTLRVGRQPYGLLPVTASERHEKGGLLEHLENFLLDLLIHWSNADAVPVLDPDSSDVPPDDLVAERASEVGEIYGATPHLRELRLRTVDDTQEELSDLYDLRLGFAGLLCALMPKDDGTYHTPEDLDTNGWYQIFLRHEPRAQGGEGVAGQLDALRQMVADLDAAGGNEQQEGAALAIRTYLNRFEAQPAGSDDDVISGDVLGIVGRHQERVEAAQPYLAPLGAFDGLGAERAPRLYSGAYGDDGTETVVGVLVAATADDAAAATLASWLETVRADVVTWDGGGVRPDYIAADPVPLLHQLIQHSAASVARGPAAAAVADGLARLRDLLEAEGAAALGTIERLMRGALGLASYRVDAWLTALATERLATERVKRQAGLQVGGYGWLLGVKQREGGASQGHIHAPSLDHATTAAILRSGWAAFGTEDAGSPLAVDLSAGRIRAARWLIEGVRSGQELGRLLGGRFERRLHDRDLDHHIDDVREAVLRGSDATGPATRIVDGLLVARAYTDGIEKTPTEVAVRAELEPIVTPDAALMRAVTDTVADLDAVSDVLIAQAVHSLARGDAGVAAPTLAATGSGDSGLPAIDFPESARGGRPVTARVTGLLRPDEVAPVWRAASSSPAAAAEPRLERWAGLALGDPAKIVAELSSGSKVAQVSLTELGLGAIDAVFLGDALAGAVIEASGLGAGAAIASGRPAGLADDQLSWGEFLVVAHALRETIGRLRPLTAGDLAAVPDDAVDTRDLADLQERFAAAEGRVPDGDPRHDAVEQHRTDHPEETADTVAERLAILAGHPVPILPLLTAGVPDAVAGSFATRETAAGTAAWMAQAAKVRTDLARFTGAVELAELAARRGLLQFAVAQAPDPGGPWAATGQPEASGPHTAWCNVTGAPPSGPVAGFVVDAWTEMIPATQATSAIAVHFDRPSAVAPNAVLLAVARPGQSFGLDLVRRCIGDTLTAMQYRAVPADAERAALGQFLPAVFLPGDAVVLAEEVPA